MYYYRFTATTPYCGTDNEYYYEFAEPLSDSEKETICEELMQENASGFEYLVHGWCSTPEDEGITEEEWQEDIDNYYADCYCSCEEITEEEYMENH